MKLKILIVGIILGLLFISFAYAHSWSNPTVITTNPQPEKKITHTCSNLEWNGYFSDYRTGILTKEEALSKLKMCDRW